ncbi:MAG: hypothetical protein AAF605_09095, partial [Myxococcota bacterium]
WPRCALRNPRDHRKVPRPWVAEAVVVDDTIAPAEVVATEPSSTLKNVWHGFPTWTVNGVVSTETPRERAHRLGVVAHGLSSECEQPGQIPRITDHLLRHQLSERGLEILGLCLDELGVDV